MSARGSSYRGSGRRVVASDRLTRAEKREVNRLAWRGSQRAESETEDDGVRPARMAIVGTLRQATIHNSQAVVEYLLRQELRSSEARLCIGRMNEIFKQAVGDFEDVITDQQERIKELEVQLAHAESELANQAVPLMDDDEFAPSIRNKTSIRRPRVEPAVMPEDPMRQLARSLGQAPGILSATPVACAPMPYPVARLLDDREKPKQNITFIIHYNECVTQEAVMGRLNEEREALSRYAVGRDQQRGETVVAVTYRRRKSTVGAKTFQLGGRVPLVALPARKTSQQAFSYVERLPGAIRWGEAGDVSEADAQE